MGPLFVPEQAESVSIGGVEVIFRMSGDRRTALTRCSSSGWSPGRLIPSHAHEREHQVSYVLEGEIGPPAALTVGRARDEASPMRLRSPEAAVGSRSSG